MEATKIKFFKLASPKPKMHTALFLKPTIPFHFQYLYHSIVVAQTDNRHANRTVLHWEWYDRRKVHTREDLAAKSRN